MSSSFSLAEAELDFLCERLGLDELPYPIEIRSSGATMNERAALRERTVAGLAERGLVDGTGRAQPWVEDVFAVLCRAELSVDAVHLGAAGHEPTLALAAALGAQGVLAEQDSRGLRVRAVPADGLASAVLDLLPALRRGSEKSVTVPLEELISAHGVDFMQRRAASNGGGSVLGAASAAADADRKTLARLHAQPRECGGQLGVNARGSTGSRTRAPVLSWFGTESGSYLTQAGKSQDGRDWITIAPADVPALRHRLNEMLGAAAHR